LDQEFSLHCLLNLLLQIQKNLDSLAGQGVLDEAWNRSLYVDIRNVGDVCLPFLDLLQDEASYVKFRDDSVWVLVEGEFAALIAHISLVPFDFDCVDSHNFSVRDGAWHFHDGVDNLDCLVIIDNFNLVNVIMDNFHQVGVGEEGENLFEGQVDG
jgi:hypothetical protein